MSTIALAGKGFYSLRMESPPNQGRSSLRIIFRALAYLLVMALQTGVLAFFSISAILGGMKAYDLFSRTDTFCIHHLAISGLHKLTEGKIQDLAGVGIGQNIFALNLRDISKNIARNPWVQDAAVRRELPNGLAIDVTERKPFARVYAKGTGYLIDEAGFVMAVVAQGQYQELPEITSAGPAVTKRNILVYPRIFTTALSLLKFSRKSSLFRDPLERVRIANESTLILKTLRQKTEIKIDAGNLVDKLSRLEAIYDYAKMEDKIIQSIDLCYRSKAVVKFAEGGL